MLRILAFAASNSLHSINRELVVVATRQFRQNFITDVDFELLDLNDFEMPIYSIDREVNSGIPESAELFFHKIGSADAVIVSFAEHNGTVTVAWKNIFDWMSRIDTAVWQQKALLFLAATPGKRAGAGVLDYVQSASYFGGIVAASLGIGNWSKSYDPVDCKLRWEEDRQALDAALSDFQNALRRSQWDNA